MKNPVASSASFWPYGIVLSFVLFAGLIFYLVYGAMQTDLNMVTPDYYQRDQNYDQQQTAARNGEQLGEALSLAVAASGRELRLRLPGGAPIAQGQLLFFRPADSKLDFTLPLAPGQATEAEVDISQLAPGYWKLQVSFTQNGQPYYKEFSFTR
ncbi:MAG: FixH family protein [Bernardetiaceae bacterium]|jgi:hypothetical protein|nr:FixH family protein [Bernardetiaceae bacterium]